MKNVTYDRFLITYFTVESVADSFAVSKRVIFDELAAVYMLDGKETKDQLFAACENLVNILGEGLTTPAKYAKASRLLEYCMLTGVDSGFSDEEIRLFRLKGVGLRAAEDAKLVSDHILPDAEVLRLLDDGVQSGEVTAFEVLGFLLVNGFGVAKNEARGKRLLSKGAKWNSLDCALTLLRYEETPENLKTVKALCDYESTGDLYLTVEKRYPEIAALLPSAEIKLVSKYFSMYPEAKRRYDAQVSRIAFSDVLSYSDKARLLYSESRALLGAVNTLPIGDVNHGEYNADPSLFDGMLLKREKEWNKVWIKLGSVDMRGAEEYRPMLLVCPDEFVLDVYKAAIARVYSGKPVSVDAQTFGDAELSSCTDNYLLSAVSDSKDMNALVFVDNVNKLPEHYVFPFSKLLQPRYTSVFSVANADGIALDLSGTVQVLFATSRVNPAIAEICDVIELEPVRADEKGKVLDFSVEKWKNRCGEEILFSSAAAEKLFRYSAADMDQIVAELAFVAKAYRKAGKDFKVSDKLVEECAAKHTAGRTAFGFGGNA